MRKQLTLVIAILFAFASCSKNSDTEKSQSVNINGIDYPTIIIGNQIWTTVNYRGPGGKDAAVALDANSYGKYYGIRDFVNVTLPSGWRIPSKEDYDILLQTQPGAVIESLYTISYQSASDAFRSKSGWIKGPQGTNLAKFNGLPAGYFNDGHTIEAYHEIGEEAMFLTTTKTPYPGAYGNYAFFLSATYQPYFSENKDVRCGVGTRFDDDRCSLRFVKDK